MQTPFFKSILVIISVLVAQVTLAQKPVNWTEAQLLEPAQLAQTIKAQKNVPVIISIGPGALIPGSVDVGATDNKEGIAKLNKTLIKLKKDTAVVVYCGCCPFAHCPNVRPAIDRLAQMGFTNYKLLNLPRNIKMDWMDKGYPTGKL